MPISVEENIEDLTVRNVLNRAARISNQGRLDDAVSSLHLFRSVYMDNGELTDAFVSYVQRYLDDNDTIIDSKTREALRGELADIAKTIDLDQCVMDLCLASDREFFSWRGQKSEPMLASTLKAYLLANPADPNGLYLLGLVYFKAGCADLAKESRERAQSLDPHIDNSFKAWFAEIATRVVKNALKLQDFYTAAEICRFLHRSPLIIAFHMEEIETDISEIIAELGLKRGTSRQARQPSSPIERQQLSLRIERHELHNINFDKLPGIEHYINVQTNWAIVTIILNEGSEKFVADLLSDLLKLKVPFALEGHNQELSNPREQTIGSGNFSRTIKPNT